MKLSEQWLRQWVDPSLSMEALAEQLTMAGFEVEAIESCAARFRKVIVARVVRVDAHPAADRLQVCEVETGDGIQNVVCGADNVAAGRCFPLALPGAILADGSKIRETTLKDVKSAGMLCSGYELGLSTDATQLFELHDDAPPGTDLADYLDLADHVLDLSLTPNRGDCLSLAGIAREVGVLNAMPVKGPVESRCAVSSEEQRPVSLTAAKACPRYAGRVITNIDLRRRAPDWLLERLRRAGLRSINAVVDISNYVMLELGQPTHAFDNDKLQGEIVVRFAAEGEELTLLDGQHCKLQQNTLLITDENGPVALGGIMGGLDTAVSDETRNLFLESAYFDPESIAGRARSYGLHTDASHRYERGVDFTLQERALERFTELLVECCGGNVGPIVVAASPQHLPSRPKVRLELKTLQRFLGIEIEARRVGQILQQLDLEVAETLTGFEAGVPSFRFDIEIEADLIEEVARVYGYNNIAGIAPRAGLRMQGSGTDASLPDLQQCLLQRGYHEVITYSFVDEAVQEKILGPVTSIPLLNPISSDLGVMRCSLFPGLITTLVYNYSRQQERIRLFECGKVYRNEVQLEQTPMIGGITLGNIYPKQWDSRYSSSDIYDMKSDIEALVLSASGTRVIDYRRSRHPALHSGQSLEVIVENQKVGVMGALHPGLARDFGLSQPVFVFEINLVDISAKRAVKFTKVSKFPAVKRDISILVSRNIPVREVLRSVEEAAGELLSNLELFDLYQGEGIDIEKKSLALGLTFQRSSSTLTEGEVETVMAEILRALHSEHGATLRE